MPCFVYTEVPSRATNCIQTVEMSNEEIENLGTNRILGQNILSKNII